jgi:hypothetical protein
VLCEDPKGAAPALALFKVVRFPGPGPAEALDLHAYKRYFSID